jgi:thiol-disulfide isomerase/thioredoxin
MKARSITKTTRSYWLMTFAITIFLVAAVLFVTSKNVPREKYEDRDQLILFHANWCGHCKTFVPEVEKFRAKGIIKVTLVEDSDITDDMRQAYDVNAYPMLFYKDNHSNKKQLFTGERVASAIEQFVHNTRNHI